MPRRSQVRVSSIPTFPRLGRFGASNSTANSNDKRGAGPPVRPSAVHPGGATRVHDTAGQRRGVIPLLPHYCYTITSRIADGGRQPLAAPGADAVLRGGRMHGASGRLALALLAGMAVAFAGASPVAALEVVVTIKPLHALVARVLTAAGSPH